MSEPNIVVNVVSEFVPQQSNVDASRYVYSYTITIENLDTKPFKLLSRHWVIQDDNMKVEEVYGEGVVGEQPVIFPGKSYTYTSGAVLDTDIGTMEGKYFFVEVNEISEVVSNESIEVPIPKFLLSVPRTIH